MVAKGRIVLALVALALVSTGCDWAQFGYGPTHTYFNSGESTFTTANVAQTTPEWILGNNDGASEASSLVTWGKHLAFTSNAPTNSRTIKVVAADGSSCSGSPRVCTPEWTSAPGTYSDIAVSGGRLYIGSRVDADHASLLVFDAEGATNCAGTPKVCSPLWSASWPEPSAGAHTPVVAGGRVYVPGVAFTRVFDAAGTTNCIGTDCAPLFTLTGAIGTPSIDKGLVFSSTGTGLAVFDATGSTGCGAGGCAPLRTLTTTSAPNTPALSGGRVYTVTSTAIEVFDEAGTTGCSGTPTTCAPLWTAPVTSFGTPVVTTDTVFVVSAGGLKAFDAAGVNGCTGTPKICAPIWTGTAPGYDLRFNLAATGSILFVDGFNRSTIRSAVHAFDIKGAAGCTGTPKVCTSLWNTNPIGDITVANLIVGNGRIFYAWRDFGVNIYKAP